jgi:putative ABC transport system ATP-binding protein
MDKIGFHWVVPHIFSQCIDTLSSDIWCKDVSFCKGNLYLVEADSGKGKSTFCSYVMGYRNDYTGSVIFDEMSASSFKVVDWIDLRKHHLAYLFQELRLFPELTAYENVEIKNKLTGFKTRGQIVEWFDMLGIGDKLDAKVSHMSFGQQQRVAMMRALAQPFDFILADEPISHLDDANSEVMGRLMMIEAKAQGAGVIVTSIGKHMNLDYDKVFRL